MNDVKTNFWLEYELAAGLQLLVALRLKNAPDDTTINQTLDAWLLVFRSKNIDWNEADDRQRLKNAFVSIGRDCEWFPTPKTLFEHMRPRERGESDKYLALEKPENRVIAPEVQAEIDKILGRRVVINFKRGGQAETDSQTGQDSQAEPDLHDRPIEWREIKEIGREQKM